MSAALLRHGIAAVVTLAIIAAAVRGTAGMRSDDARHYAAQAVTSLARVAEVQPSA